MSNSHPSTPSPSLRSAEAAIERLADGHCASPAGFRCAGLHVGIKRTRDDLALLVADGGAAVAGMFTSNRVRASCVDYCSEALAGGRADAVIVNSGNANACTGPGGMEDTREMAALVGRGLDCDPAAVFVCSTGVIGRRLPMDVLRAGIPRVIDGLEASDEAGMAAARAILTTDTVTKTAALRVHLSAGTVTLGGMAKGSGMIGPDLEAPSLPHATTLAFLTTDAVVDAGRLQRHLATAMDHSFNAITVDGDTSTNDTVLLLAGGASGVGLETAEDEAAFAEALRRLALELALMIVRDGEGAQRLIEVRVGGARSVADARRVARTVAESPLVKTAFCAGEPNWGRFLMAVGRAGVELSQDRLAVSVNDLEVVRGGMGTDHDPEDLRREMTRDTVLLSIDLGEDASSEASMWTCDLTEEYVRINGHYLT